MLTGFLVSATMKIFLSVKGITLPIYFDPFFVGLASNIIAMIIGSALTKVSDKEKEERALLFVIPEEEKNPAEVKKTLRSVKLSLALGAIVIVALLVLWVIPYLQGLAS